MNLSRIVKEHSYTFNKIILREKCEEELNYQKGLGVARGRAGNLRVIFVSPGYSQVRSSQSNKTTEFTTSSRLTFLETLPPNFQRLFSLKRMWIL